MQKQKNHRPFTLVLGGGGARGLAHIGVLRSLEQHELIPSLIVGTSMGALVGGMYAQCRNSKNVEEKLRDFFQGDFFKRIGLEHFPDTDSDNSISAWERFTALLRERFFFSKSVLGTGMFAQATLLHAIHSLFEDQDIRQFPVRFAAVACDLATGEEFVFTSGSVITAVAASSAVPGVVAPFNFDSRLLIDGTVTSTIPVPAARSLSPNPVIAVDVRRSLSNVNTFRHGYETIIHANEITSRILNDIHLHQADVVLSPDVTSIDWNEFHQFENCLQAGEHSVEKNISVIERILTKEKFRLFHWRRRAPVS